MFQSAQLPPPSQSNTLPPIPALAPNLSARYPPASYHPSLASASPTLPPLPSNSSSQLPWPAQRTSSSREERYPARSQEIKVKPLIHDPVPPPPPSQQPESQKESEDNMPPTSDFVKKLYKMLEDPSFQRVVSWGPNGDCFVVKDMNEFTKSILPRMFKHSNFASFVRQLNKYDFHKVKNTDDSQFGEHSWTFRHPDFHADRRDALENIKRKVPAARKSLSARGAHGDSPSPSSVTIEALQAQVERLVQTQDDMSAHIRHLENNYQNVLTEMVNFQRNMAQQDGLMQNLISYFLQMENARVGHWKTKAEDPLSSFTSDANPFLPTQEAQRMMGSYPETDVARASLFQMNEISRRAEVAGMSFSANVSGTGTASASASAPPPGTSGAPGASTSASTTNSSGSSNPPRPRSAQQIFAAAAGLLIPQLNPADGDVPLSRQDTLARIEELQRNRPQSAQGADGPSAPSGSDSFVMPVDPPVDGTIAQYGPQSIAHEGLQVFTLGHLLPRSGEDDANGNWTFDPNSLNGLLPLPLGSADENEVVNPSPTSANPSGTPFETRPNSAQMLRVRRSAYVPGWAVPPRVLLVEDDAVSRKLSSKFLQVFGCTIDVAVDGVGAVNKMNLEKYDLVLMDIVMPKLDGVSATNLIRQFDHMTPIISMTSNSKPNEIMTYYHSGMNDILPKPFTKEGLLEMLEKHLMHLKAIQQMGKFSRAIGAPDTSIEEDPETSLAVQPSMNPPVEDPGRIDPLAGMGLTQQQYQLILQGLVHGDNSLNPVINVAGPGAGVSIGSEKRSLDDADDERDGKRGRFEVLE
ncbi:HSF-type DNA-binding-domain-containing protein [Multifurca ochricompacta]|uniref:HSF-type DNA-binding-domain-containing protein n=1 Tax=Multifurca ochricompacta TaxID=376703 RepID=A0AAD4M9G2_9AGAM|nr:HSF-type DNA-binding-domain-containing protein [Multifurca ochricompacta]